MVPNMPLQQKQYLTHYAPMIIERWALPIFKKAGCSLSKTPVQHLVLPFSAHAHAVRSASSTTDLNLGKLSHPLTIYIVNDTYMYICDFCNRTYHWACLENSGCYTEISVSRDREKSTKMISGSAQLVLTLLDSKLRNKVNYDINPTNRYHSYRPL